jgi:hypothetical protein
MGAWGSPMGRVQNIESTGRSGASAAGSSRLRAIGRDLDWAKGWEELLPVVIGQ